METKGRVALRRELDARGWKQKDLAERLNGIEQSNVSFWLSGRTRPDPPNRKALQLLLGIPEDDWLTDEESSHVDAVRASVEHDPTPTLPLGPAIPCRACVGGKVNGLSCGHCGGKGVIGHEMPRAAVGG